MAYQINEQAKQKLLELQEMELALELELRRRKEDEINPKVSLQIESNAKSVAAAYPLKQYIHDTFPIIEPGRKFDSGWHIDIISEFLTAAALGDIRNFIINIPRRCMKSLLVCVMFPTWVWTFMPHTRWIFTAYSKGFCERDNEQCSKLINSSYYQQRFPGIHLWKQTKTMLKNTMGGHRIVFQIGQGVGEGGDFVIADDPNAIHEVESETVTQATNYGWNEVSYHNVIDKRTAVRGVMQQRTGVDDVTGSIVEDEELKHLYTHLCLPMKYESDHPYGNTPSNPLFLGFVSEHEKIENPNLVVGQKKLWIDPRDLKASEFDNVWYQEWYKNSFLAEGYKSEGDGQLLWTNRMPLEEVEKDIAHLKVHGEATQFQQRPIRRGGNFFNSNDFKEISIGEIDFDNLIYCRGWDKAGTKGAGDETVGLLMARTNDRPYDFYILDVFSAKISYYDRMQEMIRLAAEDTFNYVEQRENTAYSIRIEREGASAGKDLASIERDALTGYDVDIYTPKGKKSYRSQPVKQKSEEGRIYYVRGAWNVPFFRELEKYDPAKEHQQDNKIDALGLTFRKLAFTNIRRGGSRQSRL